MTDDSSKQSDMNDDDPKDKQKAKDLGVGKERLSSESFITIDKQTAEEQKRLREKTLAELDRNKEEQMTQIIAEDNGIGYQNLKVYPVDKIALAILTKEEAEKYNALCIYKSSIELLIATTRPHDQVFLKLIDRLEKKYGIKPRVILVSQSSFKEGMEQYKYVILPKEHKSDVEIGKGEFVKAKAKIKSLEELQLRLREIPTTEIIDIIISAAIDVESSDIHIEPEEEDIKIRYRIDGVLQDVAKLTTEIFPQILSRVKLLSKLKLNVSKIPQDGRFDVKVGDRKIDIRTSTLPSAFGETIVLRILGTRASELFLEDLGLRDRDFQTINDQLQKPNGMILTTGPTGSGKTTTLYAFLNKVNTPEVKIITIEDPIEYRLPGISQTQTDKEKGYDFASGLKSILRQDPDIIMVGEIRDAETAEIGMQAALTGHVVFSTLHTNDSSGVIPRLINMGVRPVTIAPAINAVIAQRLVRLLCQKCMKMTKAEDAVVEKIKKELGKHADETKLKNLQISQPQGCITCNQTGYKGRKGIFEIFVVDKAMEELILSAASTAEIRQHTLQTGMLTIRQDGFLKVLDGITTIEEVERVT